MLFRPKGDTPSLQAIVDAVYSIGIVTCFHNSVDPNTAFGGVWVKIAEGRTLMGANSSHAVGTTAEAGLPNITGSLSDFAGGVAMGGALSIGKNFYRNPRVYIKKYCKLDLVIRKKLHV